jgi:hypothetical protein
VSRYAAAKPGIYMIRISAKERVSTQQVSCVTLGVKEWSNDGYYMTD